MRRAWDPALEPRVPAVKRRSREAWIVMQRRLTFIVVAVDRICMRARFCNRISSNERLEDRLNPARSTFTKFTETTCLTFEMPFNELILFIFYFIEKHTILYHDYTKIEKLEVTELTRFNYWWITLMLCKLRNWTVLRLILEEKKFF